MHVKAEWQLQDAKANFSQLVTRAEEDGPQRITRHGRAAAVLLSERDFGRLLTRSRGSLSEFLARSPLGQIDIDVRDHADTGRESEF